MTGANVCRSIEPICGQNKQYNVVTGLTSTVYRCEDWNKTFTLKFLEIDDCDISRAKVTVTLHRNDQ